MAFTQEEKQALLELKANGYSFEDAIGFVATNRTGNVSKVEREFNGRSEVAPAQSRDDALSDLSAGFSDAKGAFKEGLERSADAEKREGFLERQLGIAGAGFRFAGEATGSVIGGALRALPGGTTALNKIEDVVGAGVEKVADTELARGAQRKFEQLPEGVQQTAGDVGNIAMGALGIAEPLVAPGASRALSTGIRQFAESGVKGVGREGIQSSINIGLAPEDLMQRVARISKGKQAKFEKTAKQSVGEYLVERQIFGDPEAITQQLYNRIQTSKGRVDSGLSQVGGTYTNGSVKDALEQLAEREARVSSPNTPSSDQRRVNELLTKHEKGGLTLTEVNEVKRLYERNVKLDYLRDNVSDGIAKANNVDNNLRDFVEKKAADGGFADVYDLNKETRLAKQLLDDLGAEYAGQQGNNFVSLSDAFFLAEGAGNPTALAAFGLKRGLSSKATMSTVAKMLARKRKPKDVPEGNVTGPLSLPEAGQTSAPPSPAIPLSSRAQSTIDAQERTRIQSQTRQPDSTSQEDPIKHLVNIETDAAETVRAQMLDIAEAGIREIEDGKFIRTSSFPSWIPKDLRQKKLFEAVWNHIDSGTTPAPSAHRQWELYALTRNEIQKVEYEKLRQENGWELGWDDIPFSVALAVGGSTAAYFLNDETIFPMIGVMGMMALSPAEQLKLINKQIKALAKAEDEMIKSGAKRSDNNVKDIVNARRKLEKERNALPD